MLTPSYYHNHSLDVMLEQSVVNFKGNKNVKRENILSARYLVSGKSSFRLILASGFVILILYLIIQKCEKDALQSIFNKVDIYENYNQVLHIIIGYYPASKM